MILVGSRAANRFYPNEFPNPKDYDVICNLPEDKQAIKDMLVRHKDNIRSAKMADSGRYYRVKFKTGESFEFELPVDGDNKESVESMQYGAYLTTIPGIGTINLPDPNDLFWLKWAHVVRPIKFDKTIKDYFTLARATKVGIFNIEPTKPTEWAKIRRKEVERRYPVNVNLNQSNDEFFAKSQRLLGRVLEHDDLHRATKFWDVPLFEKMKSDKTKASVEKDIWDKWGIDTRLDAVREECFAIALERVVIPEYTKRHGNRPLSQIDDDLICGQFAQNAYEYALKRICTTLTSGWFRQFAINNYFGLLNPRKSYGESFKEWAILNGK
jgi:hypothetical protein